MAFAVFLCCLYKIGVFTEADAPAVVLKLFNKSVTFWFQSRKNYESTLPDDNSIIMDVHEQY